MIKYHKQKKRWSCGAASFRNLLELYGRKYPECKIRSITNTNRLGTDENDLKNACERMKLEHKEIQILKRKYGSKAFCVLIKYLNEGKKVLLCVDNFSHWVLAVGHRNRKVIIVDPENGVQTIKYFDRIRLLNRWWGSDSKCFEKSQYYGLVVWK